MKRSAAFLQMALFFSISSAAYSQSLADIAKKEKERRQEIKDSRVITDKEAEKYRSQPSAASTQEQPGAKEDAVADKKAAEGSGVKKSEEAEPDEPVDFQGRPESYWRKTMAEAREKVANLENEANAIVARISTLQTQFYNEDDGFKREGIGRDLNKSYYEQDKNKEELAKAKEILLDLEKEARKSGALPGWIQ
ncbi:MAG: hypothetical protein H6Q07_1939 [Acidobacteria bacterium]|nr:hypothetical protein [Acidobacteriota bacterium]